jgi:hypothetical protein
MTNYYASEVSFIYEGNSINQESKEQRAKSKEQRAKSKEQRATKLTYQK